MDLLSVDDRFDNVDVLRALGTIGVSGSKSLSLSLWGKHIGTETMSYGQVAICQRANERCLPNACHAHDGHIL